VDADDDRRDAVHQMLVAASWSCRAFASIEEFLVEHQGNQRGCVIVGVDSARAGNMVGIGVSAALQSRRVDLPVILLTSRSDVSGIAEAIRGGAFDCLTMPLRPERLQLCVTQAMEEYDRRRVAREKLLQLRKQMDQMTQRQRHLVGWVCSNFSPHEAAQLVRSNGGQNGEDGTNGHSMGGVGHWSGFDPDLIDALPRRARQTLDFLLRGDSEKQIATRLELSRHTVHDYVKMVYRRLQVSSRAELMAKCLGGYAEAQQGEGR
jgi:FixJ family two-component response regulator